MVAAAISPKVFVDTSAFLALLEAEQPHHAETVALFLRAETTMRLVTTSFVVHEAWALIQRRLGWDALDAFVNTVLTRCEIVIIDAPLYEAGATLCRARRVRGLSLTDCVSFAYMREEGITHALAFDEHFTHEGFTRP